MPNIGTRFSVYRPHNKCGTHTYRMITFVMSLSCVSGDMQSRQVP